MTFSRTHTGMVGIISLFTGMIAPVLTDGILSYAFPMTSLQTLSYLILILLVIEFSLVSTRKWEIFNIIGIIILLSIGYMGYESFVGWVSSRDGLPLSHLQWGWIFLLIGVIMFILSYFLPTSSENESSVTQVSDGIIGTIGSLTLLVFSLLIIGASYQWSHDRPLLKKLLTNASGVTLADFTGGVMTAPAYTNLSHLKFERKNDRLTYQVAETGGIVLYPENTFYTGTQLQTVWLGDTQVVRSEDGIWIGEAMSSWVTSSILEPNALLMHRNSDGTTIIVTEKWERTFTGKNIDLQSINISHDEDTIVWIERTASWEVLYKNGKALSDAYSSISELTLSQNGASNLALAKNESRPILVLKNGIPAENIRTGALLGSWQTNGAHSIYVARDGDIQHVIYDGVSIGKEFSDVREIFLEKDGNGYAYFAREKGSDTYCLFTRYRGNLCGLLGYMNPRLSADGSTVIFLGKRDNVWSIYRNTNVIVRDTGYTTADNSGDYVYYDITNPRQYIIVERMPDGKYQIRKNGKIIPMIIDDFWLDVEFGYDGKVIMSVKDDTGWHIIELDS